MRAIGVAPDGTGLAYLATHGGASDAGGGTDGPGGNGGGGGNGGACLWWQVWEGGAPPLLLASGGACHAYGRIVAFGWAPPAEDEETTFENEETGEEETEVLPGLRLWVTFVRHGAAHTQLIDLQGAILGAFELPILGDAVLWLSDGRRVLVTESAEWYPALWDGAALAAMRSPSASPPS